MLIGATRCGDKCENTVLLETQGPCERVRECSADTVTDDTGAQVKDVTSFNRVTTGCVSSPTNWAVSRGSHMHQNEFLVFAATSRRNLRNADQEIRLRFPSGNSCPF